jgi:glycosyltransferase involved in cell wall biosynthesis
MSLIENQLFKNVNIGLANERLAMCDKPGLSAWDVLKAADTTTSLAKPDPITQSQVPTTPRQDRPLVSVIIPNYNHARYVGEAIQSVLEQSYQPIEIIVVDDGSTDESRDVISAFSENIQSIYQKNQGLSAARNTGIRAASGEYISLLDADDLYEADFISTLIKLLKASPDADGIYCGYRFVDEQNRPLFQKEARLIPSHQLYTALLNGNFLVPECVMVSRHCYEIVGLFDESLTACEDWDMWLRISQQFNIISVDQVLIRHRVLTGSMSSDPLRMLQNRLAVLRMRIGGHTSEPGELSSSQRATYGQAYFTTCIEYLQRHDITNAYDCFHKAITIYPELLTDLSTYYELGCGNQPKGVRGNFATLDITHNANILFKLLNQLFSEPAHRKLLQQYQHDAFNRAYVALGLLSYGAAQFDKARAFLSSAIANDPKLILDRPTMMTLIKSMPFLSMLKRKQPTQGVA